LKKINIGGVPEHFNLPWLDAIDQFDAHAERFHWCPQPQGTGAMVEGLGAGTLDVAVMLTEGAVAASARGGAFDIEHTYVESPLQWGIHVPASLAARDEESIRGLRYAISRRGSGSHLMSCAHALVHGWPVADLEFVVVGTLEGAVEAFREQRADVFFWERYMTAPLVAAGEFRRVGIFEAPWPAFVVCLARRLDDEQREQFAGLYAQVLHAAQAFAADSGIAATRLGDTFGIERDAALEWLAHTRWATTEGTDAQTLRRVAEVLVDAGLIAAIPNF
jgi:sulfonate transport system substrate-binding protein